MFGAQRRAALRSGIGAQRIGAGIDGFDEYVSDPAHPVPYRQRPIQPTYFPGGSKWSTWLVEDQRFVDDRADVLSWETPPLDADVTIAGEVVAHLFASTTGSDADWIVKLIDVYPEDNPSNWNLAGFQLMVSNEVFRGRYRTSFEKPAADRAEQGPRVHVEPAHAELHVQEGPPHHGAGAEHVVPDHRSQPADVRAEYLSRRRRATSRPRRTAFIGRRSTLRASTCRSFARDELTELDVLAHHHQRLGGVVEDAEEIAGLVAGVDILAVDEERDRAAAFDRFVETRLETGLQDLQQLANPRNRETLAAQIREHHQLEQFDRRVAALGEAAGLGLVRCEPSAETASPSPTTAAGGRVSPVNWATSREL